MDIVVAGDSGGQSERLDAPPMQAAVAQVLGCGYLQHLQVGSCSAEQQDAFALRQAVGFFEDDREGGARLHVDLASLYEAMAV